MTVEFVAGSATQGTLTAVTGPTITLTGYTPVEGDVVILPCSSTSTSTGTGTLSPADWYDCGSGPRSHTDGSMAARMVCHVITAAEAAAGTNSWTVTGVFAGTETGNWWATVIRGGDPASIIDASSMTYDEADAPATSYLPGLAGADLSDDSLVVSFISGDNPARTWTTPSGWTKHNPGAGWLGSRNSLTAAGVDVPATAIVPNIADEYISYSVAIKALTVAGPVLVDVDPATIVLAGLDLTADAGGTETVADSAAVTLTGVTPTLVGSGATVVAVDPATLTLTGVSFKRQLTPELFDLAATRRVFFGHQSVGAQVLTGIGELAGDLGRPDPVEVRKPADAFPATGGFLSDAYVGLNGDGFTKTRGDHSVGEPTAEPSFAQRIAEYADDIDTAVLKFCYADLRPGSSHYAIGAYTPTMLFDEYKAMMAEVEAAYPAITFVYATETIVNIGDEDHTNGANALRMQFNELVRAEYGNTGRLWDIALAESTDPDGNRYLDAGVEYLYLGYASADLEHISGVGGIGRKAAATPLVLVLADIAASASSDPSTTVDLSGSGSLAAAATLSVAAPSVALSGAGTLTAVPAVTAAGTTAALGGTGSLVAASGTPGPAAAAVLTGDGLLATAAKPAAGATATLTGAGNLTVAAGNSYTSTAALTGTGSVTTAARPTSTAGVTLTGTGLLAASAAPLLALLIALAGTGTLITNGPPIIWRNLTIHTGPAGYTRIVSGPAIRRTIHPGRTL